MRACCRRSEKEKGQRMKIAIGVDKEREVFPCSILRRIRFYGEKEQKMGWGSDSVKERKLNPNRKIDIKNRLTE